MGWEKTDIFAAMREIARTGGLLYGQHPGVLVVEVPDEEADLRAEHEADERQGLRR